MWRSSRCRPSSPRQALETLGAKGCRAVICFTAGFAEVDEAGAEAQAMMVVAARGTACACSGPNCLGVFNDAVGFYATFSASFEKGWPVPGRIGIASQSGAYGTHMFARRARPRPRHAGLHHHGQRGRRGARRVIGWMAQAPEVEVICAYAEGIRESTRFIAALELRAAQPQADRA